MLMDGRSHFCTRLPRSTVGKVKFQHTATQLYLGAQEGVEAQSAHGAELAAVHSEQAVEAEVPSRGRS